MRSVATDEIIVLRLTEGDNLHDCISQVCKENNIDSAVIVTGLGMISHVTFGWFTGNEYLTETRDGVFELVGLSGNISYKGNDIYPHLHAIFSMEDHSVEGGHILKATVHNNVEIFIQPLKTVFLNRSFDGWFDALAPEKRTS
jgi:predicted DNA-binding protein with PD1-like motif